MTASSPRTRRRVVGRLLGGAGRLLDAMLPAGCAICRAAVPAHRPPVCDLCASRVHPVPPPRCPRCGATRLIDIGFGEGCPDCVTWPSGLRAASACLHEGVAAQLVRGFKYRGYTAVAPYLAARMVSPARRLTRDHAPLLVPVPLAPARLRERGFNQAELLANALASRTGWPVARLLERPSGGPSMARHGRLDRRALVRSAYALRQGAELRIRNGTRLLIVDDVITTGATIAACTQVLTGAGAHCVGAISFTRTSAPLDGT